MGGKETKVQRPAKAPQVVPDDQLVQAKTTATPSKTPPPFQLKAEGEAPKAPTKTPEEIALKKKELDENPAVIKPDQDFVATDPALVNATLERNGYKRVDKMDENTNLMGVNISGGINPLMLPKIQKANAAFEALKNSTNPEDQQKATQIQSMIQKIGGAVFRVQKKNFVNLDKWLAEPYGLVGYRYAKVSDHALGCAVDVNANTATMQNAHFESNTKVKVGRKNVKANDLMQFVEKVVRTTDASFDLDKVKGVDLMNRINSFSTAFPEYIKQLMANEGVSDITDIWAQEEIILKTLRKKPKAQPNKLILSNWQIFKGWEKGTSSKKFDEGKDHKVLDGPDQLQYGERGRLNLLGIVDLNETFLKIMLDAGFEWGGDFDRGNKDFMHFEDRAAMAAMKK